jgi:putative redox protein
MTVRLYADRRQWPLEGVEVALRHQRVRAEAPATGWVDRIEERLTLHGPLDAEQHQRLTEIAGRCPIHRAIVQGVQVVHAPEVAAPDASE